MNHLLIHSLIMKSHTRLLTLHKTTSQTLANLSLINKKSLNIHIKTALFSEVVSKLEKRNGNRYMLTISLLLKSTYTISEIDLPGALIMCQVVFQYKEQLKKSNYSYVS